MMKKVLVLSGSPRKGDSYGIVKLIEKKMSDSGDVEFEYLMLRKYSIEYCRGCLICMRKGEDSCPLNDDIPMIRDKMLNSDGVIFTSPVYVHSVTASIKNLFDRMAYYLHRPCFHNKYALIVSTTELSGLKEALDYLAFPIKSIGFNLVGEIGVLAPAFNEQGPYQNQIRADIDKAKEDLFHSMMTRNPMNPGIGDIVFFNKLKTKIKIHKNRFAADYEYWRNKGWLDADYFFPAKINFIHKVIDALPVKLVKITLRKKLGAAAYKKFIGQYS